MPAKVQQDKAAWQWVETLQDPKDVSQENLETAYRYNFGPCPKGECRRNCRGNPLCLNGLGERSWYKELDENCCRDFDPESERRKEGKFVGLKNLGATCYVNTFLQLWFHNAEVRRAVYQWQDVDQPSEIDPDWKPSSICGHLQLLFGLMQHSKRAYIDPSPLIDCLGLDTGEQQDAQEFSKLFLSVLERSLMQGFADQPSNIVQQQFAGTYCYVTRCQACGSESSREATFYELDVTIRGHSSLISSLHDFLKEEKLEGENQYMCSVCNSKQNAVRSIQLQTLPPVLNLQLLRFVFDVKKGHKKKLNSYLQFGDVLDMSEFLQQPAMTTVYDLTAVLIHRGPSAYSGHYVAHIQDTASKLWYHFNDKETAVMKGKKLHLGKEEDVPGEFQELNEPENLKPQRIPKGMHSSHDAYMLVYTRRKQAESGKGDESPVVMDKLEDLPAPVRTYVEQDNTKFEEWIQDIALTQDANLFSRKEKQSLVQSIYSALFCNPGEDFDWVPMDWISGWLSDPDKTPPINTSPYLCPHGRLHPDDVCKMKIVSRAGVSHLYEEYGGLNHLKGRDAMCLECVQQRCRELQLKEQLAKASRILNAALKQPTNGDQCYWVGKASLRNWKRYAFEQIGASESTSEIADKPAGKREESQSNGTGDQHAQDTDCSEENIAMYTGVNQEATDLNHHEYADDTEEKVAMDTSVSHYAKNKNHCEDKEWTEEKVSMDTSVIQCFKGLDQQGYRTCMVEKVATDTSFSQHEQDLNDIGNSDFTEERVALDTGVSQHSKVMDHHGDGNRNENKVAVNTEVSHLAKDMDNHGDGNCDKEKIAMDTKICQQDKAADQQGNVSCTEEMDANGEQDTFNSDLLCEEHGALNPDESCRRLVSEAAWKQLHLLFPDSPQFHKNDAVCPQCMSNMIKVQEVKAECRQRNARQKEMLQDLYHGRNRPVLSRLVGCTRVFAITSSFLHAWRKSVRNREGSQLEPLSEIVNKPLLCQHDKLLYPVPLPDDCASSDLVLVWESEWEGLKQHYAFDVAIEVFTIQEDGGQMTVVTVPEVCDGCVAKRLQDEFEDQFTFEQETIFVRKVVQPFPGSASDWQSSTQEDDPDFVQVKKKTDTTDPSTAKRPKLEEGVVRKSQRHRKQRGEKEIKISSDLKLRDFKIKVMNLFSIPTFDQNLSVDGRPVTDNNATLGQLRFYPGCVVTVKADEPTQDSFNAMETVSARKLEEGFKGTSLLSS